MKLLNDIGLIGDFIGSVPAMIELSKKEELEIELHPEAIPLFDLLPNKYNIIRVEKLDKVDLKTDLVEAFRRANKNGWHMTQAHFSVLGLPVPDKPIRPDLQIEFLDEWEWVDYIIAPFSRSLPENQKVSKKVWQRLVDMMPNKCFYLFGNSKHDDVNFIKGKNVFPYFDRDFKSVRNTMLQAKYGVISVVTGISHLAYGFQVKNFLITNQGTSGWGINPDAICITDSIPNISEYDIFYHLKKYE